MGKKWNNTKTLPKVIIWGLCSITCSLFSTVVNAQVSVQLPATVNNGARDRIVTPERFECENSLSGKAQLEYGVAASNGDSTSVYNTSNTTGKTVTVYGKIIIPIGGPKSRIDCNELYELEVKRRKLEIKLLEMQTNPDFFKPSAIPKQ